MSRLWLLFFLTVALAACTSPGGGRPAPAPTPPASGTSHSDSGKASWYGARHQGKRTASGERFDQNALTAAHRSLPFGTRVKVTNLNNRSSVTVRINDRGPYSRDRILDVSRRAAAELDLIRSGVAPVRIEW